MPCYHPVRGIITSVNGKIKFLPKIGPIESAETKMTVPCGRCTGCREAHAKMWAIRCVNEISMHQQSSFITLTYADEHLPKNGTLHKKHLTDFIKRYRKKISPTKIRYFACGEYGDKLGRPHFHILTFGHQFDDREHYQGNLYTSPTLEKIWGKGFCPVGEANFSTAAYIARYVTKKITGDIADKHYVRPDLETGELIPILGEYSTMSNRPGIGYDWYQKYKNDVYPSDEIIHEGHPYPVPRYYDKLLERDNPDLYRRVKQKRIDTFETLDPKEFHWKRLLDKERCKQAKIKIHLKRKYEETAQC